MAARKSRKSRKSKKSRKGSGLRRTIDAVQITFGPLTNEQMRKLYKIEDLLGEIGVTFDTGQGYGGRDWMWDFSLDGPVRVKHLEKIKVKGKSQKHGAMRD